MKKLLLFSLLIFLFAACKKDKLTGQGPSIIEAREGVVQNTQIHSVRITGSTKLTIAHGEMYDLELKGYTNLVNAIKTEVLNNVLIIEYPENYQVTNDNVVVRFTIPQIPNVRVNGASNTTLIGSYPDKENLNLQVNGSGSILAAIGKVKNLEIISNGSGSINAYNFISENVIASMNGSGEIKTTALNNLKARISGSGNINYFGNPIIDSNISGSGKLIKVN